MISIKKESFVKLSDFVLEDWKEKTKHDFKLDYIVYRKNQKHLSIVFKIHTLFEGKILRDSMEYDLILENGLISRTKNKSIFGFNDIDLNEILEGDRVCCDSFYEAHISSEVLSNLTYIVHRFNLDWAVKNKKITKEDAEYINIEEVNSEWDCELVKKIPDLFSSMLRDIEKELLKAKIVA